MRILIITDYLPYPPISGDTIRVYNLIRRISDYHEIYLLALFESLDTANSISQLSKYCRQVTVVSHQWPNPLTCIPDLVQYFIEGKPMELRLLYSRQLAELVYQLTSEENIDVVQIEHSRLALYRDCINPSSHCASVLALHNIAYDQIDRLLQFDKNPMDRIRTWIFARQLRQWEPSYAGKFDRCLTVSELDRKILLGLNSDLDIDVIPNGTDTKKFQRLETDQDVPALLFIGSMDYAPCADGAIFFCKEILPYIQEKIPEIEVWIVGASPSAQVT